MSSIMNKSILTGMKTNHKSVHSLPNKHS